jgi:hypothetical protein
MHQFQGFPDLRLNSRTQASGTMLWPSFTDIMTMILMVFMLTMVAVILKNAYLADLVRLSQGRLAVSERKLDETLALNIDLEDKLRAKEMEIILLGDELGQLSGSLQAKVAIIDQLSEREKELLENIRLLQLDAERAKDRLEASELRLSELTAERGARSGPESSNRRSAEPAPGEGSRAVDAQRPEERSRAGSGPAATGLLLPRGQVSAPGPARP